MEKEKIQEQIEKGEKGKEKENRTKNPRKH
jgi:hypothetical protein